MQHQAQGRGSCESAASGAGGMAPERRKNNGSGEAICTTQISKESMLPTDRA